MRYLKCPGPRKNRPVSEWTPKTERLAHLPIEMAAAVGSASRGKLLRSWRRKSSPTRLHRRSWLGSSRRAQTDKTPLMDLVYRSCEPKADEFGKNRKLLADGYELCRLFAQLKRQAGYQSIFCAAEYTKCGMDGGFAEAPLKTENASMSKRKSRDRRRGRGPNYAQSSGSVCQATEFFSAPLQEVVPLPR